MQLNSEIHPPRKVMSDLHVVSCCYLGFVLYLEESSLGQYYHVKRNF